MHGLAVRDGSRCSRPPRDGLEQDDDVEAHRCRLDVEEGTEVGERTCLIVSSTTSPGMGTSSILPARSLLAAHSPTREAGRCSCRQQGLEIGEGGLGPHRPHHAQLAVDLDQQLGARASLTMGIDTSTSQDALDFGEDLG